MDEVIIKYTDDPEATEKMKECCPGSPFVVFSNKPGVKLEFVNPIPGSGLFSKYIVINNGDTYRKVVEKLAKHFRQIKSKQFYYHLYQLQFTVFCFVELELVDLYHFEDPILGLVTMPSFDEPLKDKAAIPRDSTFNVDLNTSEINIVLDKKTIALGKQVTYILREK